MLDKIVNVINSSEIKFHINVQVQKDLEAAKKYNTLIQHDVLQLKKTLEEDGVLNENYRDMISTILDTAVDESKKLESVSSGLVLDININKKEGEEENDK